MTTRIGIIGDPHSKAAPVKEALAIFRNKEVTKILCTGDLAGYGDELEETVALIQDSGCECVLGNHDAWYLEKHSGREKSAVSEYLGQLPETLEFAIEGKQIYMVHGSPDEPLSGGIRLLDEFGEIIPDLQDSWQQHLATFPYDVLIVSHTHQIFVKKLGRPLVVNPGSVRFNHSCAILSLPDLTCEIIPLSNKTPLKSWNWYIFRRSGEI